jgi:sugar phosphate isomerase/epimerase
MTISKLPIGYCTNVHAGRSLADVEAGLNEYTVPVAKRCGAALAAGLWLSRPVVSELLGDHSTLEQFAAGLTQRDLVCYTLNAFPYGDFHDVRVKEKVYLPDWTTNERLEYTVDCARVLAGLLADNVEGSISTVPLGFKEFEHPSDFLDACCQQLIALAGALDELREHTGKTVRLAIEPEPFCVLETTPEAIAFFEHLRSRSADTGALDVVDTHIGLCYDICHQAVEFEDVAASIGSLDAAGIRINKVHITCAIELDRPGENAAALNALAGYVEPRYLHQTMAKSASGKILRVVDLTEELATRPDTEFLDAEMWRVHYHVPVDAENLGPLGTTRSDVRTALRAVAALDYAPHLEVETYTWEVLPGGEKPDLVTGLARELTATRELLGEIAGE